MPLRHDPSAPYDYTVRITRPGTGPVSTLTSLDPAGLHNNTAWGFLAQTCLPGAAFRLVTADDDDSLGTEIATRDGSWAIGWHTAENGRYHVDQTGPRRLWDILELTHHQWTTLGQPRWDRFGLTIQPHRQTIWLDLPDSGHSWPAA